MHTNRRTTGAWTQRYEHGIPSTGLTPITEEGTTGTIVHYSPDRALLPDTQHPLAELTPLAQLLSPHLQTKIRHERG